MAGQRLAAWIALALVITAAGPAMAADPPAREAEIEGLTVTAPKSFDRQVNEFVQAQAAPTRIDQLARWADKICPRTLGLAPATNDFITARIRTIAAQVKAPVDGTATCRPNLLVIVSPEPQTILDQVRKKEPWLLGFHYLPEEKKLATVSRPIQAWYATVTYDRWGATHPDDPDDDSADNEWSVEGSRISLQLQSQFSSVLVVADTRKIVGRTLGELSDYIAVMALSQARAKDDCRPLPTVANLFAEGCPETQVAHEATATDLAYLRGLYSTNAELFRAGQMAGIAFEMRKALAAK